MKKQKRFFIQIIVFLIILFSSCQVYAIDFLSYLGEMEYSEEYLEYLKLENKENVIAPRMYEIPKRMTYVTNPLKLARMLGNSLDSDYSLTTTIPENIVVKNQQQTNSCWAFSSLAVLESNLALKDYMNNISPKIYDFSERHMEYATSKTFLDGENTNGFNREVGDGGNSYIYIPYLTNGAGAIAESGLKFENNENQIYISNIQNKDVITQVNDIVTFPAYSSSDDKTQIIQQMKQHIKNYGGIDAGIHGASISYESTSIYNSETGAIYCDDTYVYPIDHAVTIIGWDDTYSTENFVETNRPTNNGAWIIKNSWGTYIGKEGFMYVSYEDANVYKQLTGIENAQTEITYENIYQHDQYGGYTVCNFTSSKVYLASVFDKQTSGTEYLTQVAIYAPETYTCKVYVNPDGTSKSMDDLDLVQLKAGETETFDAGYHTIEFLNPIKINSDSFVVVLEIQGTEESSSSVLMEFNYGGYFGDDGTIGSIWNNVSVGTGDCFWTVQAGYESNKWYDAGKMYSLSKGNYPNFDTTIKAFTTSKILESISIENEPSKKSYIEGESFDATGMVVKANYTNGESEVITDYLIQDGEDLQLSQTTVTIIYNGQAITQTIEVIENSVDSIAITNAPSKTEYWAGEDFDKTGMIVVATYKDGTTQTIAEYTIQNGTALQNGQTSVTVEYEQKTTTQAITVKLNYVEKIDITKAPEKVKYVAGQNFDKTGMEVQATYANGTAKVVSDYTIPDGSNLQANQTTVTIAFENQTTTQTITVEVKSITAVVVKKMPTKTEYIQNKEELDLTGGIIEISYNDYTTENMAMTCEDINASGFDNQKLGNQTITLTYQEYTTTFEVIVKEEIKPENSNFDNIQGNVKRVRTYCFTDINKKGYTVINLDISNVIRATKNDKMEYYYYLSSSQAETNIADWVKIVNIDYFNNNLSFKINTSDISNYEEVSNAENLYLYIKEVATRNDIKKEVVTSSVILEINDINVEKYKDGQKIEDIIEDTEKNLSPSEGMDKTLASGIIPNAGRNILILCSIIAIIVVGRIAYVRYKDIKVK